MLTGSAYLTAGTGETASDAWRRTFAPGATGEVVDSGHFLAEERPEEVAAEVLAHLRAAADKVCGKHGARLCLPPLNLCGDNAAMVALQGYYEYQSGARAASDLNASAV